MGKSEQQLMVEFEQKFNVSVEDVSPDIDVLVRVDGEVFAKSGFVQLEGSDGRRRLKTFSCNDKQTLIALREKLLEAVQDIENAVVSLEGKPNTGVWLDEAFAEATKS